MRIGAGLRVTTETAALMLTLKASRASKDDVASALVRQHSVYAQKGENDERYYRHSVDLRIDELTSRQQEYLASWTHGT